MPTESRDPQAISDWLDVRARLASDDPDRKGCLIVNTLIEPEAQGAETRAHADARPTEIRSFFAHALADAHGEVAHDGGIAAVTDFLTGTVFALMVLGRAEAQAGMIANMAVGAKRAARAGFSHSEPSTKKRAGKSRPSQG